MSLPKTIKVIANRWKLILRPLEHEDLGEAFGLCDIRNCTITAASDVEPQQLSETLWHELTHAVDMTLGLGLTEQQVHALSAGQMAVLIDNPKLAGLLLGRK